MKLTFDEMLALFTTIVIAKPEKITRRSANHNKVEHIVSFSSSYRPKHKQDLSAWKAYKHCNTGRKAIIRGPDSAR